MNDAESKLHTAMRLDSKVYSCHGEPGRSLSDSKEGRRGTTTLGESHRVGYDRRRSGPRVEMKVVVEPSRVGRRLQRAPRAGPTVAETFLRASDEKVKRRGPSM